MLDIGDAAPSFQIIGTRGKPLGLDHVRGPRGTLLLFYPKGLGGCCGDQSPSRVITEHVSEIRSLGFEPLAIFPSARLTAEEFLTSLSLPYAVAIDSENEVHAAYGGFFPGTDIPRRTTFIIDSRSRISYSAAGGPGIDSLLNQLASTPALA
jgi:peroxiredoxin